MLWPVLAVVFLLELLELVPELSAAEVVVSELTLLPSELISVPDSSGAADSPLVCMPELERLLLPPSFGEHDAKLRHNRAETTDSDRSLSHDLRLCFIKQSLSFLK